MQKGLCLIFRSILIGSGRATLRFTQRHPNLANSNTCAHRSLNGARLQPRSATATAASICGGGGCGGGCGYLLLQAGCCGARLRLDCCSAAARLLLPDKQLDAHNGQHVHGTSVGAGYVRGLRAHTSVGINLVLPKRRARRCHTRLSRRFASEPLTANHVEPIVKSHTCETIKIPRFW